MKNKTVGLREFQQRLHANLPEPGTSTVITKYGVPAYQVTPLRASMSASAFASNGTGVQWEGGELIEQDTNQLYSRQVGFDGLEGASNNNGVQRISGDSEKGSEKG